MDIAFSCIPDAFEAGERYPQPNWAVIADWLDLQGLDDRLDEAWTVLARGWLEQLRQSMDDGYVVTESSEFLLLSKDSAELSDRLLGFCENARRTILETLVDVARDEGFGKHVVLAFEDIENYYDYIADFYPDKGEFALSGGIFLDHGYGHFVICMAYGNEHDRTIAHELNHALIRHLPLPLWLNEGVTQVVEDIVVGSSYFAVDHTTIRRHREYWSGESIHAFWSGSSFFSPDEGQELSYHLSQVLFRNLMSDFPKQISEFLNTAIYRDAGNSALKRLCQTSLGHRVKQFLGEGTWEPDDQYSELD